MSTNYVACLSYALIFRTTYTPLLTQVQVTQFKTYTFLKKVKEIEIFLKSARIFPCANESTVRRMWQKNTAGR